MRSLRVLVAPDSFKGSATAVEVAEAIASGWMAARPGDRLTVVPMADGGEGTAGVLAAGMTAARWHELSVAGPDGVPARGRWLMAASGTAILDLAEFSGLGRMRRLQPLRAHTFGFGQAILDVVQHGARRLLLGLGGSASSDCGTGALAALGARFLDRSGGPVPWGAAGLSRIAHADLTSLVPLPGGGVTMLVDVDNPLVGPRGAASVYGPQKGASAAEVTEIERGLANVAELLPGDPATPGAGAAGGTAFGLLGWGATISAGARAVGEALALPRLVAAHDVVITGEGCYDSQTDSGKVAAYVTDLAACNGIPALLVAGQTLATTAGRFEASVSLAQCAESVEDAIQRAVELLHGAGARLAHEWELTT